MKSKKTNSITPTIKPYKKKLSPVDHVNEENQIDNKTSDYSIAIEEKPKLTGKKRARCSNWEENCADRLDQFSLRDDVFGIEEFLLIERINEDCWEEAVARNPRLKEANNYAKMRFGLNKEKLAFKRGENINSTNSFTLPRFLKRYKEEVQWRAQLKNEDTKSLSAEDIQAILTKHFSENK